MGAAMGRLGAALACAALAAGAARSWAQGRAAEEGARERPALSVARGALCTAISDREPVDSRESPAEFDAELERIYFWNAVLVSTPPASIKHVWYREGKRVAEVPLTIRQARARTWSVKRISAGDWKVEAVADDGAVLHAVEFRVK